MKRAAVIGAGLYLALSLLHAIVANVGGRPDADISAFSSAAAFFVWFVLLVLLWFPVVAYELHVP